MPEMLEAIDPLAHKVDALAVNQMTRQWWHTVGVQRLHSLPQHASFLFAGCDYLGVRDAKVTNGR